MHEAIKCKLRARFQAQETPLLRSAIDGNELLYSGVCRTCVNTCMGVNL